MPPNDKSQSTSLRRAVEIHLPLRPLWLSGIKGVVKLNECKYDSFSYPKLKIGATLLRLSVVIIIFRDQPNYPAR